jgi:hypothetical protein
MLDTMILHQLVRARQHASNTLEKQIGLYRDSSYACVQYRRCSARAQFQLFQLFFFPSMQKRLDRLA